MVLIRGSAQDIQQTASRRSGPRRWLRAVEWLLAAGLHPRANTTTLRLARDLAARMDYDSGHVRYCLDATATRLGVNRSTVKRHAGYLRELGALAWVEHGSRTNIRRLMGLKGYAGTATVYAAVIPPAYDHAMGHCLIGSGYEARIVIDHRDTTAPSPADEACAPPSLTVVKEDSQVQVVGGYKDTSRQRASRPTTRLPQPRTSSKQGSTRRVPRQVARDIQIARQVRPRVNWTQSEGLRRLAFALRPLIDEGLTVEDIVVELHSWMLLWRPNRPAAHIQARLARRAEQVRSEVVARHEQEQAEARAVPPNRAFQQALTETSDCADEGQELPGIDEQPLTTAELWVLRDLGRQHPELVVTYADGVGEQAAVAIYGRMLLDNARRALTQRHLASTR